ncbi:hypothetical protein WMF11_19810 [Sorangium sp. So ce295]
MIEALQTYAVRVSGMISKRDPRKTEIVRRLLVPHRDLEAGAELDAP